ncbi:Lipoprotein [Streptomyces hygroscopicus subsp. limoneus]|nr:Lipoprotein [Streptomyces hygroscopicus subsp. limoneus]
MERYGDHRARRALLALTAAGGLLLTACSAGGAAQTADEKARDGGSGVVRQDAGGRLSTFALDVDTASYTYARRTLADGRRPDPETVRPEEFVNSFRQDYRRPDGNGFTVTVDGARTGEPDWSLVRVGLATRPAAPDAHRPPAALTFVIDTSGSMGEPGRLDLAQHALTTLTDRLRDDDSVALVTFSGDAETVLPMTRLGGHRGAVRDAVDSLEPQNSTNLGAGVEEGYATAVEGARKGATNRVVLVSDALANTGETSADAILRRIDDARRAHGITLFGVGVGSTYGDSLMERLADRGDGHTVYVSDPGEADEVFAGQLPRNIELTARDAKAQVAFDPHTAPTSASSATTTARSPTGTSATTGSTAARSGPGTPSPPCTPSTPGTAPVVTSPPPPSAGSTRRPATRTRRRAPWRPGPWPARSGGRAPASRSPRSPRTSPTPCAPAPRTARPSPAPPA